MFGSAILLASAISAPSLDQRDFERHLRAYPEWALRDGKSSAALVDLIVEPDGRVRSCVVVAFVGDERLAQDECRGLGRIKFEPGLGLDGKPILGRSKTYIKRFVQGSRQREEVQRSMKRPDMELSASSVPDGVLTIDIDLLIDAAGGVKYCDAAEQSQDAALAPFVDAACQEAAKLRTDPLADETGRFVDHVSTLRIRFEADTSS